MLRVLQRDISKRRQLRNYAETLAGEGVLA